MDYKEKTRTEESNSAELNSAEENTTAKASVEERSHLTFRRGLRVRASHLFGDIYRLPLPLVW